ncbi:hypothetical protein FRC11_013884, partial [Ceratobasidium sp. 423]
MHKHIKATIECRDKEEDESQQWQQWKLHTRLRVERAQKACQSQGTDPSKPIKIDILPPRSPIPEDVKVICICSDEELSSEASNTLDTGLMADASMATEGNNGRKYNAVMPSSDVESGIECPGPNEAPDHETTGSLQANQPPWTH